MPRAKVTGEVEAQALDLTDLLKRRPRNRIARIGVEIEGGWKVIPAGVELQRDGSVFKNAGDEGGFRRRTNPEIFFGELNTGIIEPGALKVGLKRLYPDMIDDSCGLHVHMSFPTLFIYNLLMSHAEYQESIIKYLWSWAEDEGLPKDHSLFSRLAGQSIYCQKKWWPDEQVVYAGKDHDQKRIGHRYTMIHFCWRGGRQRTVECRLLPMMLTPDQSSRAVQRILDITNASIVKLAKMHKFAPLEGNITLCPNEEYKETITEIL